MVQRRNAQKHIVSIRQMMLLLHLSRLGQTLMIVQNGLGKTGSTRGKIDGGIVLLLQAHQGRLAGAVRHQFPITLGKGGAAVSHINQQPAFAELSFYGLNTTDKFRPEKQDMYLCQICAILNLFGVKAKVKGHGNGSCFQDAEINGQPFQTVEHQDRYPVPLLNPPLNQHVGHSIGLLVKYAPGNLSPVRFRRSLLH